MRSEVRFGHPMDTRNAHWYATLRWGLLHGTAERLQQGHPSTCGWDGAEAREPEQVHASAEGPDSRRAGGSGRADVSGRTGAGESGDVPDARREGAAAPGQGGRGRSDAATDAD